MKKRWWEKGEEGVSVYVPEDDEYLGDAEMDVKNESLRVDRCVCVLYSEWPRGCVLFNERPEWLRQT